MSPSSPASASATGPSGTPGSVYAPRTRSVDSGPLGLEIDPADQLVAEQEGQDVVAEAPLGRGRVDLDPVVEAEQPLDPRPLPDHGVERRQERSGPHPARQRSLRVHIGRLLPPLHLRRQQLARLDQLGHQRTAARDVLAVVLRQVPQRAHALRPRRQQQQRLAGVGLARGRGGQHRRRQHPLGKVVQPGEVVDPPAGGDPPRVEEPLERQLGVVPVPPRPLGSGPLRQLARHDGPALGHHLVDGLDIARAFRAHPGDAAPRVLGGTGHLPTEQRMLRGRDVRGLVAPVLEELAGGGGLRQEVAGMGPEAGEEGQLLGPHQHVDGVDLDQPDPVEHAPQVAAIDPALRARVGEALGSERHPACLREGERQGRRHDAKASVSRLR